MTTIIDNDKILSCIIPDIHRLAKEGFLYLNGKLREVREIHQTTNGIQVELFTHIVPCETPRWQVIRVYETSSKA